MTRVIQFVLVCSTLTVLSCYGGPDICDDVNALPEDLSWAVLGNSIFHYNHATCQYVAGNLSLNLTKSIPSYSEGGARLSGGERTTIVEQYAAAKTYAAENDTALTAIIFDACSNDMIFDEDGVCKDVDDEACQTHIEAECQVFSDFVDQMISDGVTLIVYVGAYDYQGVWAKYNPAIDRMLAFIKQASVDKGFGFVDLKPVFEGNYAKYINIDGIHPTYRGSQAIADAITEWLSEIATE